MQLKLHVVSCDIKSCPSSSGSFLYVDIVRLELIRLQRENEHSKREYLLTSIAAVTLKPRLDYVMTLINRGLPPLGPAHTHQLLVRGYDPLRNGGYRWRDML